MNNKPQRHFYTEQEILEEIDRTTARRDRAREELNALTLRWHKLDEYEARKADKLSKSIVRIEEVRLKELGQALAAMRTQVMPFTDDKSVVLDK